MEWCSDLRCFKKAKFHDSFDMLSGWGTHGRLACPYCMEDKKAFQLANGGETSWFDCHCRFLTSDHAFRRKRKDHDHIAIAFQTPFLKQKEFIIKNSLLKNFSLWWISTEYFDHCS